LLPNQYYEDAIANIITGTVFFALLCRNYLGARFAFINYLAVGFILDSIFVVAGDFAQVGHCKYDYIPEGVGWFLYFEVHWIFVWRYWCVSESLANVRAKAWCRPWVNNAFFILVTCFTLVVYTADTIYDGMYSIHAESYYVWFPLGLITFDAFVLLVAVLRVWRILRRENMVLLNEKYMALHASLMFILAGATALNFVFLGDNSMTLTS